MRKASAPKVFKFVNTGFVPGRINCTNYIETVSTAWPSILNWTLWIPLDRLVEQPTAHSCGWAHGTTETLHLGTSILLENEEEKSSRGYTTQREGTQSAHMRPPLIDPHWYPLTTGWVNGFSIFPQRKHAESGQTILWLVDCKFFLHGSINQPINWPQQPGIIHCKIEAVKNITSLKFQPITHYATRRLT